MAKWIEISADSAGTGLYIDQTTNDLIYSIKSVEKARIALSSGALSAAQLAISGAATVGGALAVTGAITSPTIQVDKVSISLAEMILLADPPKTLVAAPGANKVLEFISLLMKLNYGSAQFTESSDDLRVAWVDESGKTASPAYETTSSFLVAAADGYGILRANQQDLLLTAAECVNTPLVLFNTSGNFGGGTGSTVDCWVSYRVHDVS